MSDSKNCLDQIGELLSGYLDGELTQQQRQRVELCCANCEECAKALEELTKLRQQVGAATLSNISQDQWRENIDDHWAVTTRGIGWLLLIAGVVLAAGWGVYQFVFFSQGPLLSKVFVVLVYGGLAMLFLSVLHQRLIERKTDKYKDVEI